MLFLFKEHTDTLFEQTKSNLQEMLEITLKKQIETSSLNPTINLFDELKWLLSKTVFEVINSAFNITHEDNGFSITTPGHWNSKSAVKSIDILHKSLELTSENDIELYVEQFKKRRVLLNDFIQSWYF